MNTKGGLLRYLGSKHKLAPWIVSFFPEHKFYTESFGATGAVLLNKKPAFLEVYNDMYDRIVNFFSVLRDNEKSERLARMLELTPYAQETYNRSFATSEDTVEDAYFFVTNCMLSYGGGIYKPGFKRDGLLRNTTYPATWRKYPEIIRACAWELRRRNIEVNKMDALKIMQRYDSPNTLHYVDPPYVQSTRGKRTRYHYEYTIKQHIRLLKFLKTLKGYVVLSGYNSPLYTKYLDGWRKETTPSYDTQGNKKTECLWLNYNPQLTLFDYADQRQI